MSERRKSSKQAIENIDSSTITSDAIQDMRRENQQIALEHKAKNLGQEKSFDAGDIARDRFNPHRTTDQGNAERLIQIAGGNLRFIDGTWYFYSQGAWRPDKAKARELVKNGVVKLLWKEVAGLVADQNDEGIKKLMKWARYTESARAIDATLKMAETDPAVYTKPEQMDANHMLLNCKNGTLNLTDGTLRKFDKSQLMTKQIGVTFDPDATCPKWEQFLNKIFDGDQELIRYIQKAVGYSITGSTKQQCWFLCFGHGANGKSVLMNTVLKLLGDYAKQAAPDLLLQATGKGMERHPAEKADLKGMRTVIAQESDDGRLLAEASIKQMTGGDTMKARHLYGNFFEFESTHKLWLATNHKPAVKDTTESTWRRLKLIPFAVTIPEQERNHNLFDELKAEYSGILTWAVKGCLLWQKEGLKDVAAIKKATASYREESDVIGTFLAECATKIDAGYTKQKEIYDAYKGWALDSGYRPIASKRFRQALEERGYRQSFISGVRVLKNIKLV